MLQFLIENYQLYIATTILLVFAFLAKAKMDISAKDGFLDKKKNKSYSWVNKYDSSFKVYSESPWWYLGLYKPSHKEKFPYSSTFLVFLTDYWHLMQFYFLNSIFLAITINVSIDLLTVTINFLFIRLIYGIVFNLFYK